MVFSRSLAVLIMCVAARGRKPRNLVMSFLLICLFPAVPQEALLCAGPAHSRIARKQNAHTQAENTNNAKLLFLVLSVFYICNVKTKKKSIIKTCILSISKYDYKYEIWFWAENLLNKKTHTHKKSRVILEYLLLFIYNLQTELVESLWMSPFLFSTKFRAPCQSGTAGGNLSLEVHAPVLWLLLVKIIFDFYKHLKLYIYLHRGRCRFKV